MMLNSCVECGATGTQILDVYTPAPDGTVRSPLRLARAVYCAEHAASLIGDGSARPVEDESLLDESSPPPVYPYPVASVAEFYGLDPAAPVRQMNRYLSPEADYGVHWRLKGWPQTFRVSYVQRTGEVYAVHNGTKRVLVLGVVPPDSQGPELYYHTLDRILEGWAEWCGRANGISWVIARLQEWEDEIGSGRGT